MLSVLDSLTVDGDEKRRLRAKLIEPEADEEAVLGTTEAELQEMRAFLDKHLHHLLVQVSCLVREKLSMIPGRSLSLCNFFFGYSQQ